MHGLVPIVGVLLLFGGIPAIILTGVIMALKNRRHKVLIEIVDVLTCYPCQKKPLPGEKLWIEEKMIFHPEMIERIEDESWLPF